MRREILSDAYLGAAWNRFRPATPGEVADANDILTPERLTERHAQFDRWRSQLEVSIEPFFSDDRRQVRVVCRGEAENVGANELVQFLAGRYAGELSATRWYDAAERLRTANNQLQSATAALVEAAHAAQRRRTSRPCERRSRCRRLFRPRRPTTSRMCRV
ncbi:MAG: hypothetical protein QM775_22115 [Pirellulales bacterium]